MASSCVELRMVWDGEGVAFSARADTTQLDVAAALRDHLESKSSEDCDNVLAGKALKPGQDAPPSRR